MLLSAITHIIPADKLIGRQETAEVEVNAGMRLRASFEQGLNQAKCVSPGLLCSVFMSLWRRTQGVHQDHPDRVSGGGCVCVLGKEGGVGGTGG